MCLKNGTTPRKLSHEGHHWQLELYELTGVGHSVYRPRCSSVEGAPAILAYLRQHQTLASLSGITARLMARYQHCDCSFEALNGAWIPEPRGQERASASSHLRIELGFQHRGAR
jgi:hypothetical protein